MRISRTRLGEIVAEEVRRRLRELVEGPADDDEDVDERKSRGPKGAEVGSADAEPIRKGPTPAGRGAMPVGPSPDMSADSDPTQTPEDETDDSDSGGVTSSGENGEEPNPDADDDMDAALDADGTAGKEPSGAINDEVSGKTVQSVTLEPKSEVLPGAKEIVISFNETTDPLRIQVTVTGAVKFGWRNQLYDLP